VRVENIQKAVRARSSFWWKDSGRVGERGVVLVVNLLTRFQWRKHVGKAGKKKIVMISVFFTMGQLLERG